MWAMRDMTDQLGKKAHKKEGKTELNPFNRVNSIQNMYKIKSKDLKGQLGAYV